MLILVITIIAIYSIWSIALFHADAPPPTPNRLASRYFMKLHLYIHCLHSAMINVSDEKS